MLCAVTVGVSHHNLIHKRTSELPVVEWPEEASPRARAEILTVIV